MANFIYFHDSYITKFDFMNYVFAKLVLASLYQMLALSYFSGKVSVSLNLMGWQLPPL